MPKPESCRFAQTHEWIAPENGAAAVGLSDHAQKEITDVVFVDPPKPGRKLKRGESCGIVESVKAAFDLYAPVSGEVVAANEALTADPGLINKDPHGEGWIFKIKPDSAAEMDALMDYPHYLEHLKSTAAHGDH